MSPCFLYTRSLTTYTFHEQAMTTTIQTLMTTIHLRHISILLRLRRLTRHYGHTTIAYDIPPRVAAPRHHIVVKEECKTADDHGLPVTTPDGELTWSDV
jgi:hypothetical protein